MPLKTLTGPLPEPATLPAVVSTTGALRCACTARDASASVPAAPLPASNDRRFNTSFSACLVIVGDLTHCGRGRSSVPSSLTTRTQAAAGRPSFIGRPVTVTLSPGLRSFFLMPARYRVLGPSASKPQSVVDSSSFVTVTHSQECGLVYSNTFTTPF